MTVLPVSVFTPCWTLNPPKASLRWSVASSKHYFLFTFKNLPPVLVDENVGFLFCGTYWSKYSPLQTCTPSCEELSPFKEFALKKCYLTYAGKLSTYTNALNENLLEEGIIRTYLVSGGKYSFKLRVSHLCFKLPRAHPPPLVAPSTLSPSRHRSYY